MKQAMHRPFNLPARLALLAALLLQAPAWSQSGPPTDVGEPRVVTLLIAKQAVAEHSTAISVRTAPVRSPAPNAKLAAATCLGVTVAPGALSAYVFEDGFESGAFDSWLAPEDATFSVRGVADLDLAVELQGFRGEALLRLELTSPRGYHYQSLEAPVVAASAANAFGEAQETRRLAGYPHPVTVRFATAPEDTDTSTSGTTHVVSMAWPLAGTHVVSHGIYGSWTASATLSATSSQAGDQVIICPAAQFTLRP